MDFIINEIKHTILFVAAFLSVLVKHPIAFIPDCVWDMVTRVCVRVAYIVGWVYGRLSRG